jgi:hypothetical protein
MKKKVLLLMMINLFLFGISHAQTAPASTIAVSGTVQTRQGDILRYAFVQDKQLKNGTYTDSLGNFSLVAGPASQLAISCRGFKDTLISVNNQTSFSIVLSSIEVATVGTKTAEVSRTTNDDINMATFRDELELNEPAVAGQIKGTITVPGGNSSKSYSVTSGGIDAAQGAIFPVFHHKDETQGSKYLFNTWVHGYVVNNKDSIIQNPIFLFNYDKIGGNLLLTKDKHAAIEIYRNLVKSFTLFDALNQSMTFTIVPEIDKSHFVQVMASGANYKIYKSIKTKFVAANYSSDGLASTGNNFDSYEDEYTYYVLAVKTNQLQTIQLKKKAIKVVFASQPDKLNQFMKDNQDADIDDSYLTNLGDYLNK